MGQIAIFVAAAAIGLGAITPAAQGQTVTLTGLSNDIKITGELVEFDGENYVVESDVGRLELSVLGVTCAGAACPEPGSIVSRFALAGMEAAPGLGEALMTGFAMALGAETTQSESLITVTARGQTLAEITLLRPADLTEGDAAPAATLLMADGPGAGMTVAVDALVAAVSPSNPVDTVRARDLRRVVAGAATNWRAVGAGDVPINLHGAPQTTGFAALAARLGLTVTPGLAAVDHARVIDAADAVSTDPFGMALLPLSQLRGAKPLAQRGSCGLVTAPTAFAVQTGQWPGALSIRVEQSDRDLPIFAREFLAFLGTDLAARIVTANGYLSAGLVDRSVNEAGQRVINAVLAAKTGRMDDLRALLDTISGAAQLSTVFRFSPGTRDLDAASLRAADVLVDALSLGVFGDKEITLIGFADDGTGAQSANAVQDALLARDEDGLLTSMRITTQGIADLAPLVCIDTPGADAINTRVEVWVRDPVD
ncbi:MAG: hypothetical protein AAF631_14950 [Pseudomonadota bacterium]